jgi:hypothetical protein
MARVKRSVWILVFKRAVIRAKRLIKKPDQLHELIKEALVKMQKHSAAIRETLSDLQIILRLVKAWLAGHYKDISLQSIAYCCPNRPRVLGSRKRKALWSRAG